MQLESVGGVLKNEKCTGDAARRAGNELVFQMLAEENIEVLKFCRTEDDSDHLPALHAHLKEYRDLGLNKDIPIIHHSEYISLLMKSGKLKSSASTSNDVVYHDACYLSRYADSSHIRYPRECHSRNGVHRSKSRKTTANIPSAAGAGGGLLFTEETEGERINHRRVKELIETGAAEVGTACPFCHMMLRDGFEGHGQRKRSLSRILRNFIAAGLPETKTEQSSTEDNS